MKQFFELFLGVFIIMIVVFISAQGVLTNTQISTAREYHETCVERIENTGLSEKFIDDLVEYTNDNTSYELTVDKVEGAEETYSYHVSLKYPVRSLMYEIFGKDDTGNYAVIDGYASVGKGTPSTTSSVVEKHGNIKYTYELGTGVSASAYEDGYLIIEGDGNITANSDMMENVKETTKNIVITGKIDKIPDGFFTDYISLEGITFGKTKEVGESSFAGCASLKSVVIPSYIELINDYAFSDCANLEYIYINNSKDSITIGNDVTVRSDNFLNIVYLKN